MLEHPNLLKQEGQSAGNRKGSSETIRETPAMVMI